MKEGIYEAVNKILFEDWDPIGVNCNCKLVDEYQSYVPSVVKLLRDGADEYKIAKYLNDITRTSIGVSLCDEKIHLETAHKLKKLL